MTTNNDDKSGGADCLRPRVSLTQSENKMSDRNCTDALLVIVERLGAAECVELISEYLRRCAADTVKSHSEAHGAPQCDDVIVGTHARILRHFADDLDNAVRVFVASDATNR
jgi:hypothetical protein